MRVERVVRRRVPRWIGAALLVITVIGLGRVVPVLAAEPKGFDEAMALFSQEKFVEAQRILDGLVSKDPADYQSRLILGWSLWSTDRYDEALFQFKTVLREAPDSRMAKLGERKVFGSDATIIDNPDLTSARKGLGWTYFKKGWARLALEQFEILNKLSSDWDEPYLGLGYTHLALGNFKNAEEAFKNYMFRTNKDNGSKKPYEGERGLGELYATQKEYARSIPYLERALKGKPNWPDAQQLLAWSYLRMGKNAEARDLFMKLKTTRLIEAEAGLAMIALQAGRLDEAEAGFVKALALAPAHAAALEGGALLRERRYKAFDTAWANYYAGKFKEAADTFTTLDQKPDSLHEITKESIKIGLGLSRLALKDPPGAEKIFRAVLNGNPKSAEAHVGLGWVAFQKKKWEEAERSFTEALAIVPQHASALEGFAAIRAARNQGYDQAWALFYQGKYTEANDAFDIIVAQPGDLPKGMIPFAKAGSGWALIELGRLDRAEERFRSALADSSDVVAEAKAGLAWVAIKRKQFADADRLLKEALTAIPGHQAALRGITELRKLIVPDLDQAWALYGQGKYTEAITSFDKILAQQKLSDDYKREALRGQAWSLYFTQQYNEALDRFAKLLRQYEDADSLEGRGLALVKMGRHKDAIEPLTKASTLAPLSADYLLALGWAELRAGEAPSALTTFLKAYNLAPASAEVNRSLGWAYVKTKRPAEALAAFRYVIGITPGEVADKEFRDLLAQEKEYRELQHDLAWSYAKWNAMELARREFESLLRSDSNNSELLFGLGMVLYTEGKLTEAEQMLKKAQNAKKVAAPRARWVSFREIGSFPVLTDVRTMLGWVAFSKKQYQDAEKLFAVALKREPEMVDAIVGLASCLAQTNKIADAREAYLRAVEVYPQYPAIHAGLRETQAAMVNLPKRSEHDASPADKR